MKLKYQEIQVNMERTQSVVAITVPLWEVPIVQAVHPNTTVLRDVVIERPAPSVSGEYNRLAIAYGAEREEGGKVGAPYIEAVYGQHAIGLSALRRAMESARLPASTPVTPPVASPALRQDLLQALSDTLAETTDLIGSADDNDEEMAA